MEESNTLVVKMEMEMGWITQVRKNIILEEKNFLGRKKDMVE